MVEEGEKTGLDASNFPTSEKDPKILSYIEEWLKVSTGETLPTIASNLKSEKDRVIGDKLVEQNKKHNEYMTDPNFKLIKKHKYSNYYSLTQEGKGQPPIIKCTGIVPMSVIDFGLCLQDEELSKIYDPTLETEIVLREIHPEIEVFRTKYKSSWPVKARDFVIAEWTHLTSEGCFYINSVDVDDEVGGELDKGYIRGTFVIILYFRLYVHSNYVVRRMDIKTYFRRRNRSYVFLRGIQFIYYIVKLISTL